MDESITTSAEVTKEFYCSEFLAKTLNNKTIELLKKLDLSWDELGLKQEIRSKRGYIILQHVEDLYNDILTEANEEKDKLVDKIAKYMNELKKLRRDLQIDISTDHLQAVPLYTVQNDLEDILKKYKNIYEQRKVLISELLAREKQLCHALGINRKCLSMSPLPNEEELIEFRNYLEELSNEKFERTETFIKAKAVIVNIIQELKVKPALHFEKQVVLGDESKFEVTTDNMTQLASYQKSLEIQMEEMRAEIAELREKLCSLWERLEESPKIRSAFLETYPGNSVDTLRALKAEVARCEEKKMANIKIFVDKARKDLVHWWGLCLYSEQQRSEFIYFTSECYTEDLLALHEIQVEILSKFYAHNKHIFELVKKHEELWKKMLDLERRGNEPNRFKNRGGELLREEKERKTVAVQLPKIEEELLELVDEYETAHGIPFKINGQHISDVLSSAWKTHKENKQFTLSAKKQARDNVPRTPLRSPMPATSAFLTPHATVMSSTGKRKIGTPLFSSAKKANTTAANSKKKCPKLQINGSTIKRASVERRKRIERRRISKPAIDNSTSSVTDYDVFELRLKRKPTCRSTLFNNQATVKPSKSPKTQTTAATPSKTRSRTPLKKPVTPKEKRSPGRLAMTLRPKSPGLPIIF